MRIDTEETIKLVGAMSAKIKKIAERMDSIDDECPLLAELMEEINIYSAALSNITKNHKSFKS